MAALPAAFVKIQALGAVRCGPWPALLALTVVAGKTTNSNCTKASAIVRARGIDMPRTVIKRACPAEGIALSVGGKLEPNGAGQNRRNHSEDP